MAGRNVLDPFEMQTRFSTEDGMGFMDSVFTELTEADKKNIERIRGIMDELPPREADFIDLYFFRHLKQTDIAQIFGVSQPTVCYRLQRATARIQFIFQLPDINVRSLEDALGGALTDDLDVQIMSLMYQTTCQSEVAKRLGVSQGLVRHRFIRSIKRLREAEGLSVYVDVFDVISKNLNILREVQRNPIERQVTHTIV
jgi:DNA-directed RNA polymerase specialized sigma subunit